jgi:bla regulator protein blaR1
LTIIRLFGMLLPLALFAQTATTAPKKEFEVASIKPNKSGDGRVMVEMTPGGRWAGHNIPVPLLIQQAYDIRESQISGGPPWLRNERFDIEAKPESGGAQGGDGDRPEALRPMFQSLLASRFHLEFHRETKEMPVYSLVTAKNGIKMKASENQGGGEGGPRNQQQIRVGRGQITAQGMSMQALANSLSRMLGRSVIDETGLKGTYDFTLSWTPDAPPPGPGPSGNDAPTATGGDGPTIFTAVQEQLGLKLDSKKAPVNLFVIDRLDRPEAN